MTERAHDRDHLSSGWDIPGPSSIAAILDSVYMSPASDNIIRNGKFKLFLFFLKLLVNEVTLEGYLI